MHFVINRLSFAFLLTLTVWSPAATPEESAARVLAEAGTKGGFVVHLGCGDGTMTAALRKNDSFQVQGLDRDEAKVMAGRARLLSEKKYGEVMLETLTGKLLPYIDNLVNLLVVEDLDGVSMDEVKRVLAPNGVALLKQGDGWEKIVKPRPTGMDEWTHYYYDAKGNAVSKDMIVAPPERLQWVGNPRWSRHHDRMSSLSAQVSSGGRMFYIMDEGSRISILLPSKWTLTARDAFNGTVLWTKKIPEWNPHMWPLKSGPTQLCRRLVAAGDKIYVTLGISAPVSCLDAATGEVIQEFAPTKGAEELLLVDQLLYTLVNPKDWSLEDFAPKLNTGDQKRVETEFNWDEQPRVLKAINVTTGAVAWEKTGKFAPLTMAVDGKSLVYHDGSKIVCLDAKSGQEKWATEGSTRKLFEYNYGPRLLLTEKEVLYAGGDGEMLAFNAADGKKLWEAPHSKSGYRSPEDLIVAQGLVWNAPTTSGGMSGAFSGRDLRTGEVKSEFPPDIDTYWFHHRCYIAKATERFILPSRTGIEFVDMEQKHWDINHWVRGACLYGVMPCNGLVYAGPHNCACYPEAKLDGMNALAPGTCSPHPAALPAAERTIAGPAFGQPVSDISPDAKDWPTYRHDNGRSGHTDQNLLANMEKHWEISLPGPLSTLSAANGMVFVSQVNAHTLYALDMVSGAEKWHFTAGGRVDSPPTFYKGRVIFGGMDGWVYCLRATDGVLIWKFMAAPNFRRHMAFEQLESVWPVHGSVLVEKDQVQLVAGRSIFLDGGLRYYNLDPITGKMLNEVVYDDKDPENGKDIQERVKTLQMPVGLNDILSSDGKWTYLRTQKIGTDGKRVDIGPVSGNAVEQGAAQQGDGCHLFSPMGFLDDSWFHRSYWVFGKSFAGGHNGYYQAGKYTPSGRMLVYDDKNVYGYGRKPEYLKWTTTMEYQLFSANREAPKVAPQAEGGGKKQKEKGKAKGRAAGSPNVRFPQSDALDPTGKPLTVEAWIMRDDGDGVILAYGGPANGYALALHEGKPAFHLRMDNKLTTAMGKEAVTDGWHHVAGVLTADLKLQTYLDGKLVAETTAPSLMKSKPKQPMEIGLDSGGSVGDYEDEFPFEGLIDEVAVSARAYTAAEMVKRSIVGSIPKEGCMVSCSFDKGDARDESGGKTNGVVSGVDTGKGKSGMALWFHKAVDNVVQKQDETKTKPGEKVPTAQASKGSFVQNNWTAFSPQFARGMVMAGNSIAVAGPADMVDEEYAFEALTRKDKSVMELLMEQDAALDGKRGAEMIFVNSTDGSQTGRLHLEAPPVWDGMIVAQGAVFVATTDGKVQRFGKP